MSTTAANLDDLLAAVRRLEAKVDAALRPAPKLLSKRAAARMLGIDRGTTLPELIRAGHLRLVMGKIPQVELERLLAEGLPEPKPRVRHPLPARDEAQAIRAMKI